MRETKYGICKNSLFYLNFSVNLKYPKKKFIFFNAFIHPFNMYFSSVQ